MVGRCMSTARRLDTSAGMYGTAPLGQHHRPLVGVARPEAMRASAELPLSQPRVPLLNLTAGMPTQTFGQAFHDGDIPVGSVPTLTIAGVSQPFSAGIQAYCPSGCLSFCVLMVNPTVSGNRR